MPLSEMIRLDSSPTAGFILFLLTILFEKFTEQEYFMLYELGICVLNKILHFHRILDFSHINTSKRYVSSYQLEMIILLLKFSNKFLCNIRLESFISKRIFFEVVDYI